MAPKSSRDAPMARVAAAELAATPASPVARSWGRRLTPALLLAPGLVLIALFFLWSMWIMLEYSFYSFESGELEKDWTLDSWRRFFTDSFYWDILWRTARLGLTVTVLSLLIGYPVAYTLARIRRRSVLIPCYVIIFSPLLVSVVVRSYGWMLLLGRQGFVNDVLTSLPFVDNPVRLVFNSTGVIIALVHILMPFAIFPMLSVLTQLPSNLKEAAQDLGATRFQTFSKVVLPLSMPGIIAAAQIVFVLSISALVTPLLLGGGRVFVLSRLIYQNITELNWPLAAVQAFVLLGMALLILVVFSRLNRATYAARER
jgi:putative spermidine/putrescine transport system permease protein